MDVLCVQHVPYRLLHAKVRVGGKTHETWLTASKSFRRTGESKTSLARFFEFNHLKGENRLDFCDRFGWGADVRKAMLVDYIIANRDRHGGNYEVLKGRDGTLRLAPLFDNGVSLCFSTYNARQLHAVDPLQDTVSHNFLGSHSLEQNLVEHVPNNLPVGQLRKEHRNTVMSGMPDALDRAINGVSGADFANFIWDMIWERWCRYESLRDSGRLQTKG